MEFLCKVSLPFSHIMVRTNRGKGRCALFGICEQKHRLVTDTEMHYLEDYLESES